ncbi:hydratase [Lecanosticta acicola]|uniref:Hydratase n=1 Tax=Lecanosticta acicola TaxID=111012 RepID=A0AAI8Z501_9PEZI|nr:hydratase [Lecanosticta acicola]
MASIRPRILSRLSAPSRLKNNNMVFKRQFAKGHDIENMLQQKSSWETYPDSIRKLAVFAEHARAHNYQIPLLSKAQQGDFDQARAYHVAAAIRQLREMNGEVIAGRKIGFSNKNLWPKYGIQESNWSYMYQNTVVDLPEKSELGEGKVVMANISHMWALEPRIEPEIIFGLKRPVNPSMSDLEFLGCIDWISHGFEVVASIFPHWKFTAVDCTAAFALHGLLLVGPKQSLSSPGLMGDKLLENLKNFNVELQRNKEKVANGTGSNVLGSPILALRHLTELLAKDEHNKPLQAGEVVTTGTLTDAMPIKDGDHWSTKVDGINLPGLEVTFKLQ